MEEDARMEKQALYDVNEVPPLQRWIPLSVQHVFAMFGATVLVPILTGLSPSLALLSSGAGTLLFIAITRGQVPAYLGSSFAFIAPLQAVAAAYGEEWIGAALGGIITVGLLYAAVAAVVYMTGTGWIERIFPPVVIGSVIVVIGLGLARVGVDMAGLCAEPGCAKVAVSIADRDVQISLFTLVVTVAVAVFARGFASVVPVLFGIAAGYAFAAALGAVDFTPVREAAWFGGPWRGPGWAAPRFDWTAISLIFPVGIVTIAEHLGDVFVLSRVVGREFYKQPGLHRTLLGDGLASSLAGLLGGPPNTTYGENVGVLAITRVYSVAVVALAAVVAILLSFVPKLGALLQTIPAPVMGGIVMVLFGIIASSGIRTLVESGIDFGHKRNLIIASVVLTLGIGGAQLSFGDFRIHGMAFAALAGLLLNLVLPRERRGEEKGAAE